MTIQAIPTRYKGYHFRSRLEARWAVFFDALGIKWEYEPQGFELPGGVKYLPDFWLADLKLWVEIKGDKPDDRDLRKARLLALEGDCAVLVYWGSPRVTWPQDIGALYAWTESGCFTERLDCGAFCQAENGLAFDCFGLKGDIHVTSEGKGKLPTPSPSNTISSDLFDKTNSAIAAARSARFEHGECGAT